MSKKVVDEPSEEAVASAKHERAATRNPLKRIVLFFRQVFAELRHVVTPTARELRSYTIVVIIFVIVMMAIVYGLDRLFSWLIVYVFGQTG